MEALFKEYQLAQVLSSTLYWRYALEAIMYDDISYVFMNKDSPWTLSMMCISKYVTCLWDYALYDDCPKRSLVERAVWTRSRLD